MSEGATHVASGKVREVYALDDERLLLVASDRISTFDVVLPTPIPDKGRVLTGMSAFWFARTRSIVPNHLLDLGADGRSTVCRRLEMLPVELVVRGYLSGSGWVDYRASGSVCGHALPPGLRESDRLPAPIVTPATKAEEGHDLNITEDVAAELCGADAYAVARQAALELYAFASAHAEARGIILADTKFELGVDGDGVVTLATRPSRRTRRASGRPTRTGPAGRSRRSTSSTCVTSASRRAGIEPTPGPRCRTTSSWAPGRATSKRSSG